MRTDQLEEVSIMGHAGLGLVAAIAAALIGAGWQVVTRFGVTTTVSPYDLALIRYAIPAVVLAPILIRHGLVPKGVHPGLLAVMVLGGGLPFGVLVMQGAQFAPAAHIAVLIPGTMPIFVSGLAIAFLGETLTRRVGLGFGLLVAGVICIGWEAVMTMGRETVFGDLLLITAAFLWGAYSVAFRRSGLDAWHGAAVICVWSTVLVVPIWLLLGSSGFSATPPAHLAMQVFWQGILAGAVGMWVYGYAVQSIGASRAASLSALVPGFSLMGGWLFLGEGPSWLSGCGVGLTILGVAVANSQPRQRVRSSP
ncbi:DMT family transporter [Thalassococcus sp. S3]|uniref:DMT family transporter n=1 Tax=Thalassococcus sp. S3 TaxID=2017482 RepID=UPI0010244D30|nr:DMT family transporter [Thalassococcus sp. S3]QBF31551.1 EamA family transporter [Thalassococcus sp. S3]